MTIANAVVTLYYPLHRVSLYVPVMVTLSPVLLLRSVTPITNCQSSGRRYLDLMLVFRPFQLVRNDPERIYGNPVNFVGDTSNVRRGPILKTER